MFAFIVLRLIFVKLANASVLIEAEHQ